MVISIVSFALGINALSQRLGDHATEGFTHSRSGVNAHMGDFKPPLKLVRTIELPGITGASVMRVFEDYLLVGAGTETFRWSLLDRDSGEVRWTHELSACSPSYANDIVLLGGSTTTAVTAVRVSTGEQLWTDSSVGNTAGVSPILTDGLAIYGGEQKVVAADAESGEVLWEFEAEIGSQAISVFGNRVYVASSETLVHALDLRTGAEVWTLSGEDRLNPISNIIPTEELLLLSVRDQDCSDGKCLSLEARSSRDGKLMWTTDGGSPLRGEVVLAYGRVFAPRDGFALAVLSSYDATTGNLVWSETEEGFALIIGMPPPTTALSHPVIANNAIYYQNLSLWGVRVRDAHSGNCLWRIPLNVPTSDLSLADGSLFLLYGGKVEVYEQSNEIFFPHIADGLGQTTHLALSNRSSETLNGVVEFYDDEGEPLVLNVDGSSGVSQVAFTIPPEGSTRVQTVGGSELQVGWARVDSDQPIHGTSIFQFSDGEGILFEAGVSAAPTLGRTQVHVERNGVFSTGIAIANPIQEGTRATLTWQINGEEVAKEEISLAPQGHVSRLIEDLFSSVTSTEFVGTVIVDSWTPVAVTAVRTQNGYQMSSYSVGQ